MNKSRIFIVEDEAIASDHLTLILKKNEYDVVGTALSGEEALHLIPACKPELVILDIDLIKGGGKLNGIQVAQFLNHYFPVPIIFLTMLTDDFVMQQIRRSSFDTFLNKPPTKIELITAIEKALERYQLPQNSDVNPNYLLLPYAGVYEAVLFSNIKYLTAANQYFVATSLSGKQYTANMSLVKFEKHYAFSGFIRVSKKYMINSSHITGFQEPATLMLDQKPFEIGMKYRKNVKKLLPFLKR